LGVGDAHHSVAEIARETTQVFGRGSVRHIEWPSSRKAVEVGDAVLSNNKIKSALGWSPLETLTGGLEKTFAFYERCLNHYLR
ncbi:MAG: hypothetical protein ABIN58_12785, partial [candidate division WOR-3 bacterium]